MATAVIDQWRANKVTAWQLLGPVLVALFAISCVAINPIGFIGGGSDENHYLDAARCWVSSGQPCLPHNHWASRWPVVAPIAASIALFGESRITIAIGPLLWWASALFLAGFLGWRWFGRAVGLACTLILASLPALTGTAMTASADIPELAFQLGALAAATLAYERDSRRWALVAGALAGFALQARDTSFLFAGAAALVWFTLPRGRRSVLLWAVPGLLAAAIAEMAVYAGATGDALYRYRLALGHVAIPSAELPRGFDTSQSPLFNPAYIAAWNREQGIRVHWIVDPWLNLLASPRIGWTLFMALIVLLLTRSALLPKQRLAIYRLGIPALLVALLLVYGLAIDPKSRMFLGLATTAGMIIAVGAVGARKDEDRRSPAVAMALLVLLQAHTVISLPSTREAESRARVWIEAHPDEIEIDDVTLSSLTLIPEAHRLAGPGSGRPLRLATVATTCADYVRPRPGAPIRVAVVDRAAASNGGAGEICLLRIRARPLTETRAGARSSRV